MDGGVKLIKTTLDSLISYDKKYFTYELLIPDNNFISFGKRLYNIIKFFFIGLSKVKLLFKIEISYFCKRIEKIF